MNRRHLLIGASALMLLPVARARATVRDFDPAAFQAAQDAGQGVVVYVHAPW